MGDDEFGRFLRSVLEKNQVDSRFVEVLPDSPSGMSAAIMEKGGDYGAVISNANTRIDAARLGDDELWEGVGMLVLQNEVPSSVNLQAALEAKKRHIAVCINAAPERALPPELQAAIDILVVNAIEARDMSGIAVNALDDALTAVVALHRQSPQVIVTAGGEGVAFIEANQPGQKIAAEPVKVISTHGAGDCFMGALCAALLESPSLAEAVLKANKAAARHISGQLL